MWSELCVGEPPVADAWCAAGFRGRLWTSGTLKDVPMVYDVCHNIAKMEEYEVDGQMQRVCVHRKGATRAFPAGNMAIPEKYRAVGQPVLIPGDMGRYSFVLVGAQGSMEQSFGCCCHGAGRQSESHGGQEIDRASKDLLIQLCTRGDDTCA